MRRNVKNVKIDVLSVCILLEPVTNVKVKYQLILLRVLLKQLWEMYLKM